MIYLAGSLSATTACLEDETISDRLNELCDVLSSFVCVGTQKTTVATEKPSNDDVDADDLVKRLVSYLMHYCRCLCAAIDRLLVLIADNQRQPFYLVKASHSKAISKNLQFLRLFQVLGSRGSPKGV
ncbi:hypothetical protein GQX74_009329 [Glossina fuscipes]|nr:hypothetical protein GQX74_009329 [Glossina fuscipes]